MNTYITLYHHRAQISHFHYITFLICNEVLKTLLYIITKNILCFFVDFEKLSVRLETFHHGGLDVLLELFGFKMHDEENFQCKRYIEEATSQLRTVPLYSS